VEPGTTLLEAAQESGVGLVSLCGGEGWCESCLVRITNGEANPPTQSELDYLGAEDLEAGYRLACQVTPQSNMRIDIPAESLSTPQRLQIEGKDFEIPLAPNLEVVDLDITPPSIQDLQADAERLVEALDEQGHADACIELPILRDLSELLRENNWTVRVVVREKEVIAILPPESGIFGISVDIGTTKLALYLVDLQTGEVVEKVGEMNPQIAYGEDVVSRIAYATQNDDGRQTLQGTLANKLNKLLAEVCRSTGINSSQVVDAVFVGNTAMHHLFAGLPVEQLVFAPYVPAINEPMDIRASAIGIEMADGAYIHLLPNIAGFVGADHVAMLLATQAWQAEELTVALDIGTNTEVSLISKGKVTSVSCASGPAFEGGHIKDGMRAAAGAIERLRIVDDGVQYQTVDEAPPIGICGSGVLDALAQLYLAGIVNEGGRMKDGHPHVRTRKKQREFVLVSKQERDGGPAIVLTQGDVRELQLAKAAIRTGIQVLLETNGRSEEEISQVVIAGAFGSYIDVSSGVTIGMLPSIPLDRFRQVGNAAGMGAKLALVSLSSRTQAKDIASRVHYVELASAPNFTQTFVAAGYLGRYWLNHGKRERID